MPTEQEYEEAIEFLVMGNHSYIEDYSSMHWFKIYEEGDGWNEPRHESSSCECGWDGLSWTQSDPQCSNRPAIFKHVFEWVKHIKEDVWREEDEGISQDSNAVQA